ncbi:MAG: tRNA preQ1(34) S-adenosylmethionine ribosyltransferase-isomerase QueA [Candidatus Omnitrophica bacterium CG11_big_fil_rev_8_21_14_0_20_45_26]|uniref:S-adenosylmethionine:tRNA ribosyltransferase-isomerase n=1 Tax=Candidatus Abzuiibacterium crystallinum TaxID=1974748 RepID=A0A2H0LSI3_9BACT|nr:MAG: tRNA preQ1(34) S-adenosylmethionine ribosyltransferase-isomerase QueA [Candidatus Omnitrophica bacterium CG11_big_fil_rev_8_21_14_0_20_45_26]PIW64764.1 MAG: tRNA preQ1(34) S-adenosylmethionine ribosyltransferase-isomerase QueA [Candidatus Omnitrophica bacterium CG12_big_fil_rev_8_21_14_0_65_45_16]
MKLSDFDYHLPKELIAQEALPERSNARLLTLNRETGSIEHRVFSDCTQLLERGDVLVLNNTKVLPARLFSKKTSGGAVEVLLLEEVETRGQTREGLTPGTHVWEVLLKPSGRVKKGQTLLFDGFQATVLDEAPENSGVRHLEFEAPVNVREVIERLGRIPLPPYIDREDLPIDRDLYQTVYAQVPGSVASPTAGLHFTDELLRALERKGVEITYLTLHVGYGTFQPVAVDNLSEHKMHAEYFDIPDETAEKINMAKADGRRVIACGTTAARALESSVKKVLPYEVNAASRKTDLFIYPPYEFKIVDAIITNFHLPRTTLLLLVSAFCGRDRLWEAYREAIDKKYRFYSYGDAMFIY